MKLASGLTGGGAGGVVVVNLPLAEQVLARAFDYLAQTEEVGE